MADNKNITELAEEIRNEGKHCEREIAKIDLEIARLQGKREALEDRKTMLWGFLN